MNKIFRIVWSQATQSWVAVSELTKAHKKQSSSNTLKAVVGSMVMMLGVNSVDAAVTIESTTGNSFVAGTAKTGSDGISIGINADTSAGANNVAIGKNAYVGLNGKGGTNPAGQSVAIGGGNEAYEGARAFGTQSVAIGGNTIAEGNSSIAIGNDDVQGAIGKQTTYTNTSGKQVRGTVGQAYEELTGKNINAEGIYRETKSGQAAVAIGVKAQAGDLSLALGTASTANQVNAVAIGSGATATRDNAVAIGGGATTEAAGTKEVNSTINNITYTWEGGQNTVAGDVVSFGRAGFERQLKHVAAGKVSKDSTDAINGSQLYGVIDGLTSGSYLHYAGDDAKGKDKTDNAVIKQSISNNRLDILGGADKATLSDNNIGVNNDGSGKLLVKLAKDLKDLTSTNVSGIVTNASGIAMADKKITGLANGDVSANSKEAVTGSQLYELTNKPLTFTGDTGTTTRKLGEATKFEGNADITTTASEGKVAFTLNKGAVAAGDTKVVSGDAVNTALNNKFNAVTLNTSGDSGTGAVNLASQNLAINGTEGIVTKAENQQVTVSLSEATKKKLAEVDTKIGNNDISLSGDKTESGSGDNTTTKVALNKTGGINFGIKGGAEGELSDKNIGVLTGTTGVTVKLAKELKDLKSIELKDGDKASKIDGNGITFTKGDKSVSLSNAGLNNGGNKITGVAKGDVSENSTDAINGAQLHELKQNVETNRYKGWKINSGKTGSGEVTGNTSTNVDSTNEVKFIAGNNVKLVQDGLNMTIQTLENVAFSKVTVGDVSIDAAGINAGNKVISNVADGAISADSKEAINGSQLHTAKTELTNALNTKAEELKTDGFSLTAQDNQSVKKKLGESIEVVGADDNVSTKVEAGKIKVALNKDLKVDSVKAGENTFNGDGLNVGGVTVSKDGINANDKKITGLANGDVSANSKEAVTGSQLYELTNKPLTFTGDTGTTTRKLGEATKFEGNADITTTASEGKVAFTLNKGAVAAGDTKVVSGDAVNTALNNKFNAVTLNTSGDSGTGAVNLASQNLAINGTEGIVTKAENQQVTVSLSEATKKKLAEVDTKIGNNDISLSGDKTESGSGDNTTTKVALNKTGGINFGIKGGAEGELSDKNIGVLTGTTGVTVKLAKELKDLKSIELKDGDKASKIDGNGITFTKGDKSVSLSNAGLNNGGNKITGVAKGDVSENSTDAINGAQLHELKQNVETNRYKGWKINSGKTGSGEVTGNTSTNVDSTNEVKFIAGNNVKLVQDGLNMTIQTLENVAFSKVTVGDVSIDAAGINAGNKVISNVADGAISADSKEAINGSQLHTAKTELTNALNTKAEELKTDGFSLTAQDNQSVKKKLGESIEVVGADDNVSTKVEAGKIKVALNKDLKVDSVKAGENTFNGDGLNVGGVTVSKDGINANDKKITGLANGEVSANSKDAVNGAQMHSMKQDIEAKRYKGWSLSVAKGEGDATVGTKSTIGSEDEVKFTADENIKLVKAGNDIKISTTKDVKFDTVTVGNTVIKDNAIAMGDTKMTDKGFEIGSVKITKDGINAGDKVISNVADGDISETSKQAINGSQLYKVKNDITSNMSNAIDTAKTELINKGFGLEADDGNTAKEKLGNTISILGKDKNIQTEVKDNKVLIGLSNNIDLGKHGEIKVGDTTINNDGVTAGDIKLNKEGLKAGDINISKDGINAGDNKISNVANGDISPTSKDAVNGSQLYSLMGSATPTTTKYETIEYDENNNPKYVSQNVPEGKSVMTQSIDGHNVAVLKTYNVHSNKEIVTNNIVEAIYNMNEQGIKFFHSNDGVERSKEEQTNSFDSSASGKFATAIGSKSKAEGEHAVAIGFNSVVTGKDSISIGTGNQVTGNNSGAFGDPSTVSGQGSYSVGNNNTVTTNDTFVLGNEVKHTVENSVVLGTKSTATAGDGSRTASLYNIKQDGTKGASTTAGSVGTVTTATVGNMTYRGFQGAKANGVVSVGAAGDERRIQNVAAGEISSTSTDAINGSQLYSVANGVANRINHLQGQVNKLGKRMNAGVAGAMAAANLMQPHKPGQSAAMAAIGQHQGEAAVAVGYSRISDNGKYGVKLSVGANTQGQLSTGAGMSYFW